MSRNRETESVTIREVYQLIEKNMGQVSASISRLETKFDNLESGRLSKLERDFANMQGKTMMVPFIISASIAVFGIVVNLVIR